MPESTHTLPSPRAVSGDSLQTIDDRSTLEGEELDCEHDVAVHNMRMPTMTVLRTEWRCVGIENLFMCLSMVLNANLLSDGTWLPTATYVNYLILSNN